MAIAVVTCNCGSADNLVRNFLSSENYKDWLTIPIYKGKEKTNSLLNSLPQYPEIDMLRNYLKNLGKYAVIIGYDERGCRWSDIAHNATKSKIEASLLLQTFA